jgi:pimeloyl-ACP methyl ester carboxylesterase
VSGPAVDRRVGGLAVHHHPGPPGAARVVLVHGSMDRAAGMLKVARRLGDLDVTRYDRRGYGRSSHRPVGGSIDAQVGDLLAVLGDEPACVVGHSLGGVIALAAAQRHPQLVPSVGAFESPMSWLDWWPSASAGNVAVAASRSTTPEDAAEQFMRRMVGDATWERLPARTRDARRSEGPALLAELAAIRDEPPYDPRSLTVPVLAGYGTDSKPYHQEAARRLAELAPLGELVVVERCGHGVHTSRPDAFAAFVRRVVERDPRHG